MNLQKLFEAQKLLDERIIKEHGLEGQDLLQNKILALLVELGECANEWRGFKHWSKDREPRTKTYKSKPVPGGECYRGIYEANPLLEEYVDVLHFILSIGIETGLDNEMENVYRKRIDFFKLKDVTSQFNGVFRFAYLMTEDDYYTELWCSFIALGELLGFTRKQVEAAYFAKNKVNHARQEEGY